MKAPHLLSLAVLAVLTAVFDMVAQAASGGGGQISPVMVVDSKGTVVGQEFPFPTAFASDGALRKINNQWFFLPVNSSGFSSTGTSFVYQSTDCSGTAYMEDGGTPLLSVPLSTSVTLVNYGLIGGTLYYVNPATLQQLTINSNLFTNADGTNQGCQPISPGQLINTAAQVQTFDLSTLKLVPPFSLK